MVMKEKEKDRDGKHGAFVAKHHNERRIPTFKDLNDNNKNITTKNLCKPTIDVPTYAKLCSRMGDVTIANPKETDLNIFVRTKVKKQDEERDLRWFKCRRESKVSRLIVSSPRTLTSSSKKVVSSKQPPSFGQTLFLYLSRYHGSSEKVGRGFAEPSNTMVYLVKTWITITSGVTNLAQVEETGGTRETPIIVTAVALRPLL
ncbi:hypothetical protein V1477_004681 [Vespula maculifrons]|uniref:Uncharacterized protein n=1 Tax=Vespula maculifrons TaxID=7453 RepID=A0ABD2CMS6_VESMC